MKCACGQRLLQKSGDGKLRLRVPILVFSGDGSSCIAPCPSCKREVTIPIVLEKAAIPDDPKLVLSKSRLTVTRSSP